ncbi:hypothetical protein [Halorubrum sp. GN11GM_10-3_MGM]|uniref:hypothetical protein n=1 Tax=Halorubrum sp. GN11GM_10-3_MGM TaxID=2518111 RepID=UPI0018EE8CB6|nr:hypothetical protein [Halorubrum sp. GN11GM_10-3_MGM]
MAVPIVLRYDFDREHAIWLIPLGGLWGLAPDIHNIAPIAAESLYALHNTPWADLFGFHYTLDRPAVRARYDASVFGSITAFLIAVAGFWTAGRVRRAALVARRPVEHVLVMGLATMLASVLATAALWVTVSIQDGFPLVAALVGRSSVLVGALLTILAGCALGVVCSVTLEVALSEPTRIDPVSTAGVGLVVGVGVWLIVVPVPLAVVSGVRIPLLHRGSLAALLVYGGVFGFVYGVVRGAFSSRAAVRIDLGPLGR